MNRIFRKHLSLKTLFHVPSRTFSSHPTPLQDAGPISSLLKTRAVIRFRGPDSLKFLQGLLTNDLRRFGEKFSTIPTPNVPFKSAPPVYAAMLTPQGKFLYDFFVYKPPRPDERLDVTGSGPGAEPDEVGLYADVDASVLDELLQTMKKYRLRSKVDIDSMADEFSCWQRYGHNLVEKPEASSVGWGGTVDQSGISASQGNDVGWQWYIDPRLDCLGFRGIFSSDSIPPLVEADKEADERNYLMWRLENGVAEGSNEIPKDVERKVSPGSEVINSSTGKKVGLVTTALGSRGLGLVRLEEAFKSKGSLAPRHQKSPLISHSFSPRNTDLRKIPSSNVAIFWDLDNKPPKAFPPYEAAVRLKKAMAEFGVVRHMIAYANRHAFSYVPPDVRERRRERKGLNQLENKGLIRPVDAYFCRVCGRRFYNNDKLVNHFRTIHEREHTKRLNRIESAKGKKRVDLVGKFSMKMEKYKNASRDVLTPKVGYGLADEIKRAGFSVKTVSDKPQAADVALEDQMVDMMDKKRADCLVLVSDDSDFVEVLKEAKMRCLKTVVVGDLNDGALKRVADSSFSWGEITRGKARKDAVTVVGKWRDRDVLKKLEWSYDPDRDRKLYGLDDEFDIERLGSEVEKFSAEEEDDDNDDSLCKDDGNVWWEIGSDASTTTS